MGQENFTLEEKDNYGPSVGIKNYWIQVTVYMPYPKKFEYNCIKASFCGTAINRALKKVRKELKGIHLTNVVIKATLL